MLAIRRVATRRKILGRNKARGGCRRVRNLRVGEKGSEDKKGATVATPEGQQLQRNAHVMGTCANDELEGDSRLFLCC